MKIAVCIKRVPDMEARFRIAAGGSAVDESGVKFDMSDFDGYAAEVALRLKESRAAGGAGGGEAGGARAAGSGAGSGTGSTDEVIAISLGPDAVQETLRKALSMGVDRAIHLKCSAVPVDGFAIATALAAELKDGGYDLILFGKLAVDSANATVGPMTAELLDIACVSAATKLDIADGRASARRELEGAAEIVDFPLPAVVTIDEGIARARLPSLKGIMAAKKKPLEVKPAQLGEASLSVVSMELPPERGAGRIIGEGPGAVTELVRLLQNEAKVL